MAETPAKRPPRKAAVKKAAVKKAAPPSRSAPPPDVPPDWIQPILEALHDSTKATNRMVESLDQTDKSNLDSRKWRRRATFAFAAVVLALGALIVQTRWAGEHRDADQRAQAAANANVDLGKCQTRNYSARYSRNLDDGLIAAISGLHAPAQVTDPLYAAVKAAPMDVDCDGDGHLTTADYPPEDVIP